MPCLRMQHICYAFTMEGNHRNVIGIAILSQLMYSEFVNKQNNIILMSYKSIYNRSFFFVHSQINYDQCIAFLILKCLRNIAQKPKVRSEHEILNYLTQHS